MKAIGIALSSLLLLMAFSFWLDVLVGKVTVNTSLKTTFNPFHVMETPELFIFLFLLVFVIGKTVYKKKKTKP